MEIITGYLGTGALLDTPGFYSQRDTECYQVSQLRKVEVITWLAQTESQNKTLLPYLFSLFTHIPNRSLCQPLYQLLPDLTGPLQTWTLTGGTFKQDSI